jgi:hypothetical protein
LVNLQISNCRINQIKKSNAVYDKAREWQKDRMRGMRAFKCWTQTSVVKQEPELFAVAEPEP